MISAAEIKHHAPGRMRLHLVQSEISSLDFRETVNSISKAQSLLRVQGNPTNRTILIEAKDEETLQIALEKLSREEILEVQTESRQNLADQFSRVKGNVDDFIFDVTSGGLNLKKLSAIFLLGLGARQFVNGHFLPAGLSLIFYSVEILKISGTDERRGR